MTNEFSPVRSRLLILADRIREGDYPHDREEWGGADVVITSTQPKSCEGGLYPEPRYIVTQFSHELSWLFEEVRDIFSSFLDGCSKIEFYGRLANMATRYHGRLKGKPEVVSDLLLAILHEAFSILEQMEEGSFECFAVAPGGTILDDLIERAESEGYLGPKETEKFFKEMERRYHDA